MCLDAKMRFDDNADFRQKKVFSYRDWTQENESEVEASRFNLNYITLDGNNFAITRLNFSHHFADNYNLKQVISAAW